MSFPEYRNLDGWALGEGLRAGRFSCRELTEAAIGEAERLNPSINAIVCEGYENALELADRFDNSSSLYELSPIAGLPFLLKDLADMAGMPTRSGSAITSGDAAGINAPITQSFINAGLNIFGKTATPEFGLTLTTEPASGTPCRNPWNLEYSTGGSSGGAAAAVAAGIVPVAHATDGGGSIRIPASCCGLVGLKPSRGLTASSNTLAGSWSGMSVGHVLSRSVRDSALFLESIRLQHPGYFPLPLVPGNFSTQSDTPFGALRIAVHNTHPLDRDIDQECLDAVAKAASLCESLGHQVEACQHPLDFRPLVKAMSVLINLHTWQMVKPYLLERGVALEDAPLESSTRLLAGVGRDISADAYVDARDTLKLAELTMAEYHRNIDVIISPVLAKTTTKLGWLDMNSADLDEYGKRFRDYSGFTAIYNGTGQPSLSLPLHQADSGLPAGVQFTAAWGGDACLLQLARQLEQAQPWPLLAPTPD